jgi:glycosyltransferase involved in cell wall biosynthesis/SAM-dependent methyltransferase
MRIACFTPLNPQRSGISDYSEALLPHLAERAGQVDVFVEGDPPAARFSQPNLRVRPFAEFDPEKDAESYDTILYQMGNNPFHVAIYELALRVPGVVALHEFNLHHLLAAVTITRGDWDGYFREVEYNGGAVALDRAYWAQTGAQEPDYDGLAMNRRLLERSQGLIVHSEYMVRAVRQAGFHLPVRKVPHGVEIAAVDRAEARRQLSKLTGFPLDEATPVFGIFGFLKPYKRIHEALRALARLRASHPQGQTARMVLVGEEHPRYPLRPLIAELGIEDAVCIAGYVSLDSFTTVIAACDVCINLRWPTVGETSGSFLRALAMGKPTLVSDVGTFREFPDDVAIRIPALVTGNGREPSRETDWLYEYMRVLLDDPALAQAVGERARAYAAEECAWPKVAGEYCEFLEEMVSRGQAAGQGAGSANDIPDFRETPRKLDVSSEELEDYIVGFSHDSPLMEEYVQTHLQRLVRTIEITPPGGPEDRVLELGCYMQMTPALRTYHGYGEVRGAYYGPVGKTHQQSATSVGDETFTCPIDLFDAERDRFPYPDGHFRTVLCCELLEHLATDPMHMIAEINRILAAGGWLILSTPNIASLRSAHAVLHGYHPGLFSSYIKPGPDGSVDPRHSREYAPRELALLSEAGGFQVDLLETGDYQERQSDFEAVRKLLASNGGSLDLRGEVIYCRARKIGLVKDRWPKELYYPP